MSTQGASNQSNEHEVSYSPESIIESVVLVLICLSSTIGNGCVITAVSRSEKLRERPGSYLVGSLAIIDGFLMPTAMVLHIALRNFSSAISESCCRFLSDYLIILIYIVILHLFLMASDRFIAVVYPLRGQIILSRRKVFYLLIPAWIMPVFSIGIIPLLLDTHEQGLSFRSKLVGCWMSSSNVEHGPSNAHRFHLLFNTLLFVAGPFVVMLVLYGIVIGAFAVTYVPTFTCTLIEAKFGPGIIPQEVFSFFTIVIFLNSAINAVVYSFRSVAYRREFKRILRDLIRKFVPDFAAQEGHQFYVGGPQVPGSSLHAQEAQTQITTAVAESTV